MAAPSGSPLSFQELATQQGWLSLGHYKRGLLGGYRSQVRGDQFFLATDGSSSPQHELEATYAKFFTGSEEQRHFFQCTYWARREFLLSQDPSLRAQALPCVELDEWMNRLNPGAVSLVFASASLQEPATSFGHVFLKLKNPARPQGEDLLDYGVNYAARTTNTQGALYAWYGLLGYFAGTYGMAPYHHLIKEYTNLEGRDLWEFDLDLQPSEIRFLMAHLRELERGYFDYYFIDDNCAQKIAEILEVARPGLHLTEPVKIWSLPIDVVHRVSAAGLVRARAYRPSLESEWESGRQQLSSTDRRGLRAFMKGEASAASLTTEALEVAQVGIELNDETKRRHELAVERARRPERPSSTPSSVPVPSSPDTWPRSSVLSVGRVTSRTDRPNALAARVAGYDLLSPETGFGAFEVLKVDYRWSDHGNGALSELDLLHILSSRPLSWGLDLAWRRDWEISGEVGTSFDIFARQLRAMEFVTLRTQEQIGGQTWLVPGLQSLLVWHLNERLRTFVGGDMEFAKRPRLSLRAGLSWRVGDDWELRFEKTADAKVLVNYHF